MSGPRLIGAHGMSTVDYRGANQTRTLFGRVMWYVAATAGFFALGSYLGRGLGYINIQLHPSSARSTAIRLLTVTRLKPI